jgi:multiple sugar transport system substrate-binding protein
MMFPSFLDKVELERLTAIPVLAELPHNDEENFFVVKEKSNGAPSELFRLLRNNIQFLFASSDKKVVMVTTSVSREGKTFISSNLAISFALTGKKVLLIGLDIRRPKAAHYFGLSNRVGIVNYLSGQERDIDKIVHPSGFANLDIMPGGPIPPNPNELLLNSSLDELFADDKYGLGGSELAFDGPTQDVIIPQFLAECALGGTHYAIPYMRSTEICYVNKTYVEALGFELPEVLTWDFVWEVAEAATAKNADGTYAVNGQQVLIPFLDKSTDNMMIQMLRQRDGGYSTDEGEILIFNDETKAILKDVATHAGTGAFFTFKISGYPANFLNAGQCVFAIDSSAGSTWMGSDAPLVDISEDKLVQFETAIRMVPQEDPNDPQMISQGPSVCLFNKGDSQQVLASWLFAQFLLTNDVQIPYAQTEGYVPVTSKAQGSAEYEDYLSRAGEDTNDHYEIKIDATRVLLNNAANTFVTPVFNGSTSLRDAAGQLIEDTTKSVRRKETIDDAYLEGLFKKVSALYHLDQLGGSSTVGDKESLGPLPTASVVLLCTLGVAWLGIAIVAAREYLGHRREG